MDVRPDVLETLKEALAQAVEEKTQFLLQVEEQGEQLEHMTAQWEAGWQEIEHLTSKLEMERGRRREVWRMSCDQVAAHDGEYTRKEEELAVLRVRRTP